MFIRGKGPVPNGDREGESTLNHCPVELDQSVHTEPKPLQLAEKVQSLVALLDDGAGVTLPFEAVRDKSTKELKRGHLLDCLAFDHNCLIFSSIQDLPRYSTLKLCQITLHATVLF